MKVGRRVQKLGLGCKTVFETDPNAQAFPKKSYSILKVGLFLNTRKFVLVSLRWKWHQVALTIIILEKITR